MTRPVPKRCAIYTRKSSDEGLDQAFNSLDAQREAGEAYVKSQASEGWKAIATPYDDGGFSGGTMERPGLKRLLADVEAGLIDVVVVYKIDRLTRSLADFARIVEQFDARGVSFVSVTQAFNTTSSMGRLTLNVLLSFAQFEREVTGERIRDKIAASKAKGMWMGGIPPLGYDLPAPGSRTLLVNAEQATTVRMIFARYLELGSVHLLARDLAAGGIVSKRHVTQAGKVTGGVPFSRGALFHLLRSPVYLGKIVHKGAIHDGAHPAIVDQAVFDAVQRQLAGRTRRTATTGEHRVEQGLLTGRIFDADGELMSPAFSRGRAGRVYRYYVSASLQQGRTTHDGETVRRVPAVALETLITATLAKLLPATPNAAALITVVNLRRDSITLTLPAALMARIRDRLGEGQAVTAGAAPATCVVTLPVTAPLRGGRRSIQAGQPLAASPDPVLIAALRKAHAMLGRDSLGLPLVTTAPVSPYDRRILRLAFLAPEIQRDILAGRQPARFNLEAFMRTELPLGWTEQRAALGWPARSGPPC
jgi:DNA invertase Pin-like site-specific DNA recombinase